MKTILLIDDGTPAAHNAARVARDIAQRLCAVICTVQFLKTPAHKKVLTLAGAHDQEQEYNQTNSIVFQTLNTEELARVIIGKDIWMIVQGMPDHTTSLTSINVKNVLHRVRCPLLLIPENFYFTGFNRIDYLTDLRYSRLPVIRDLAQLAQSWHSVLSVSHISARGIPHMHAPYAAEVFAETIAEQVPYEGLYFNPIHERNVAKAADVLINSLGTDLLVMVNHRFHFEALFGTHLPDILPDALQIPLIIYPC